MERLTDKRFNYYFYFCDDCGFYSKEDNCNAEGSTCEKYNFARVIWDKLKAYEDTGLSPEEVTKLEPALDEIERLREMLKGATVVTETAQSIIDREDAYWRL